MFHSNSAGDRDSEWKISVQVWQNHKQQKTRFLRDMLKTLITDAFSSSANNKLWELMVFILKWFSHLNFDGAYWLDAVCKADKTNSRQACWDTSKKYRFSFKRRMRLVCIRGADSGHAGLFFLTTILVPFSDQPLCCTTYDTSSCPILALSETSPHMV